jgi:hypothetical protein
VVVVEKGCDGREGCAGLGERRGVGRAEVALFVGECVEYRRGTRPLRRTLLLCSGGAPRRQSVRGAVLRVAALWRIDASIDHTVEDKEGR